MEAAARGASEEGGVVVGLLPGHDRSAANGYLTVALPTGLGQLRNGLVVNAADGVICVGGSWGTLNELSLAMRMDKPTAVIDGWLITPTGPEPPRSPLQAGSADEAVRMVLDGIEKVRGGHGGRWCAESGSGEPLEGL
jgi:uncharacterized protein (TIGR00725 family)